MPYKKKCVARVQRKIRHNIKERKIRGGLKRIVAVSYAQVRRKYPNCVRYLRKKRK